MGREMIKPDAVLDGEEFSAISRLLEALHARKEAGVDKKGLEAADVAAKALSNLEFVATDDLDALVKAAKAYQKAVEDDKLESVPNVKDLELKKVIKKLEGMQQAQETTDKDGNKIHPASQPAGEKEHKDAQDNDPVPTTKVEIVKAKEDKKADQKQTPAPAAAAAPKG